LPSHPDIIEPTHKKGRESQARIVQAILRLIETTPFDQLTIAEIMAEAEMAVGTFYRRFKTKESVLPFVFAAYGQLFENWARGFEDYSLETSDEIIEMIVRRTAKLFAQNAGLIRTVHLYIRLHPDLQITRPGRNALGDGLGAVLAKDFDHPTKDDLARGQMAVLTMVSVMTEQYLYRAHSPANATKLSNAAVQDLLIHMLKSLKA